MDDNERQAVERFKDVLSKQESVESRTAGLQFQPRSGDVLIVTPPKCGTTWVQQIVQSLRTRGSMDFEEICLTIPCLEMAVDHGYGDLQAPQPGCLRAFKTHFWYPDCPKCDGAKFIYVLRDPKDVDTFAREFVLKRGAPPSPQTNAGFWHHIASWYPHRRAPDVLWLHYEDLVEDLDACIRKIAGFLGIELDSELLAVTREQASLGFMRSNSSKYDEHMLKRNRNEASGLRRDAGLGNGNQGKVRDGPKAQLSPALLQAFQEQWDAVVKPVCGHATYDEFREAVRRETL